MALDVQPNGRFATMVHAAMERKEMSLTDVASHLGTTYEHMRKIIKGFAFPAKQTTAELVKYLGLNKAEAERALAADRIQHKHGDTALQLFGKNPELDTIEKAWPYLQEFQKQAINSMAATFARENRATGMKAAK